MAKGNRPPSRIRYEQTHPVISIRVDRDTAEVLKEISISTDKSLGQLVKENLKIQKIKEDEIQRRVDEAYDQAVEDYEVWYYCSRCGKRMSVSPNSNSHKAIIQYMKEHGWGHKNCL